MCSFWDEEKKDWSQDGCVLVSGITSSDERHEESVRCSCDHLTSFAVIMVSEKQLGIIIFIITVQLLPGQLKPDYLKQNI